MIGLTVATHFLTGNGGMMIMMMGMSVITLITSVHSFFSDKKQNKRLKAKKMENYKAYLNEKYKLELPESENYETLGGLVVDISESIPQKNEQVSIDNYRFLVEEVAENKILTIRVFIE